MRGQQQKGRKKHGREGETEGVGSTGELYENGERKGETRSRGQGGGNKYAVNNNSLQQEFRGGGTVRFLAIINGHTTPYF